MVPLSVTNVRMPFSRAFFLSSCKKYLVHFSLFSMNDALDLMSYFQVIATGADDPTL